MKTYLTTLPLKRGREGERHRERERERERREFMYPYKGWKPHMKKYLSV
jgi:hypothetical protein